MSEAEQAAAARAGYVEALREELDGYKRAGKDERAADVQAELDRVQGKPQGRSETPTTPAPRKPRSKG